MKKIIIPLLALALTSCDFLEYSEYSGYEKDDVYKSFNHVKESLTQVYSYLSGSYGSIDGAMRAAASDEAVYVDKLCDVHSMNNGAWSASNTLDTRWELFNAIRSANMFLDEIRGQEFDEYKRNPDYQEMMAQVQYYPYEARFLRAYYHFELARRYGDIPIITTVLTPEEANVISRDPFDEVIRFIVDECDQIAPHLPSSYANVMQAETGRATRGAALALKARALLYAASPLFNTGNDVERWKEAAAAAGDFIRQASELGYSLPDLSKLWNQNYANNTELILGVMQTPSNSFEAQNFPVGIDGAGNTGHCPTQNLVDAFEMKATGLPVVNTDYAEADPAYTDNDPYAGRDPRLQATIAVNNSIWVYNSPVQIWQGGQSGKPVKNATKTGYYLKKFVDGTTSLKVDNTSSKSHVWTLMRYSEVLLNYAEAMVEGYGDYNYKDTPALPLTAKEAVDMVRARAGVEMPAFPSTLTLDEFKSKLRNERRVELAFEDHRFWDIRRWKIGDQTTKIYGMDIFPLDGTHFRYERILVEERIFEERMYLYPIPYSERLKNPNLGQNKGW